MLSKQVLDHEDPLMVSPEDLPCLCCSTVLVEEYCNAGDIVGRQ